MKRYCVQYVTGREYDFNGNEHCIYRSRYFDDPVKAENFRKWMKGHGADVTNVMDLENLPF